MNEQQKKNRRTIVLLFSMTIIPFCIAWYLSNNWTGISTSQGQLVTPPVTTEINEFIGFDAFSTTNMKELRGHWVLINIIPTARCEKACKDALHATKQLRLMMNKDVSRIRRVVLVAADVSVDVAQAWWLKDDKRLLHAKPAASLVQKVKQIRGGDVPEGMLLLMDPLGNIMMQYKAGFDPYKVKRDLGKLLRISQIG